MIQGVLQGLIFHLDNMNTLNPQIKGDMKFQRGLNIKQNLEFQSLQNLLLFSYFFLPSKQLIPNLNYFCGFV
jgi:hypothetical protein